MVTARPSHPVRAASALLALAATAGLLAPVAAAAAVAPATRVPARLAAAAGTTVQGEAMALPAGAGAAVAEAGASGGRALLVWSNAAATATLTAPAGDLRLRVRADLCAGAPHAVVAVDGRTVATRAVASAAWHDQVLTGAWPGGTHRVAVSFADDFRDGTCDRNLRLDAVTAGGTTAPAPAPAPAPPPAPAGNPFAGARGYVDPASPARRAADARRGWDPAGAAALDKAASGPAATWYGDWVPASSLAAQVSARVAAETAAGALPVLVAYAVPHRDCGSFSAGGVPDAAAYRAWVRQLAAGIGARRAVVVLEPDALAQLQDCLAPAAQQERTALLAEAVGILSANPGTAVYLDAGNPTWITAATMAERLRAAGVARARGFALNVSSFATDAAVRAYGDDLSARLGGKTYVADTSRNGRGPGDTWCNPAGRGLGQRFTTATGSPRADAFTWIKRPGESDGTCGGGPAAGTFWVEQAIGLGQRAAF